MNIHGHPWISNDINGYPLISIDIYADHGYQWISIDGKPNWLYFKFRMPFPIPASQNSQLGGYI